MRLIITRHGKTIENQEGIHQGHLNGTLSELGKEQARRVAERLKNEKIDYIYSSDLGRASDTVKEIAKFHPITPIEFVRDLRERYLGIFQGKKEVNKELINNHGSIESKKEVYERAKKFLDDVIHKHHTDTVLFVGHNSINKAIIGIIINKKSDEIYDIENLHNTSISIYEIDEDKNHEIILFNCKKHLD